MMQVILNGLEIQDRAALHGTIVRQLSFPEWYGGNLDALWDCLTDMNDPVEFLVQNREALEENLGSYADLLYRVLKDAALENEGITLAFEE